jgi:hypothetical protein|tara:strand:- start:175 stop:681 length:507 start_codon:yes stop_codon:yes gene_type:complete
MTALFISTRYLKRKSIIDGQLDDDKLVQFIETAQDMHIQNYLGSNLYKKMQSLVISGDIDLAENENYKNLIVDYVKPMLAWYTQAEYIPFSQYTMANGGVFKHRSENSDTAEYGEVAGLATRAQDKATFYTNRFLAYMCDNYNLFPEYNAASDDMYPDKDVNTIGWVL